MIVDNRDNNSQSTYTPPLVQYLRDSYTYKGDILSDINSDATIFYIEIPYINRDAAVLFRLWFIDHIKDFLHLITEENYSIHNFCTIYKKVLTKETADSLIVQHNIVNVCSFAPGTYIAVNNGTYNFKFTFFESLPIEMVQLLEDKFYYLIDTFRKHNNEITI